MFNMFSYTTTQSGNKEHGGSDIIVTLVCRALLVGIFLQFDGGTQQSHNHRSGIFLARYHACAANNIE
jgi:hypothetical protein